MLKRYESLLVKAWQDTCLKSDTDLRASYKLYPSIYYIKEHPDFQESWRRVFDKGLECQGKGQWLPIARG